MFNSIQIQCKQDQTKPETVLLLDPELSLYQLHKAIQVLFEEATCDTYAFQFQHHNISSAQAFHTPLCAYLQQDTTFTYTYGTQNPQCLTLVASWQADHTKHTIDLILKEGQNMHSQQLQAKLDSLYDTNTKEQNLATLLASIRKQLYKMKAIAPHLLLFKEEDHTYPYYLDVLDNGMELMIFPDEATFARSIINASNNDPDLLFTSAFTFDFLYDDLPSSELPLYDHHNLCFKNEPGALPRGFHKEELDEILVRLIAFYEVVCKQTTLPSMGNQEMLVVRGASISVQPFCVQEEINALFLSSDDQLRFSTYPHTSESYRLMFQAVPGNKPEELDIKLCAANANFHKECIVHPASMESLGEEIYQFMKQLFKERGLAEEIRIYSCNLYHLISNICEELDIFCSLHDNRTTCDSELLELIAQTFQLSQEEILMVEPQTQPVSKANKVWN